MKSHEKADKIAERLSIPKPMRRGSLSERFVKCSKPGCPCAEHRDKRHGPYYSITRSIAGKTKSRFLSREQVDIARQQIENGKKFREDIEAFWQECEYWADMELDVAASKNESLQKKRASRKHSPRK